MDRPTASHGNAGHGRLYQTRPSASAFVAVILMGQIVTTGRVVHRRRACARLIAGLGS